MSVRNGSCSGALMDNTRDPESSAGANRAPQTPQGCSLSDGACRTESVSVTVVIDSLGERHGIHVLASCALDVECERRSHDHLRGGVSALGARRERVTLPAPIDFDTNHGT